MISSSHYRRALGALAMITLTACGGGGGGASTAPAAKTASDTGVTADQILLGGTIALSGPAAAYGTIAKASDAYFKYVNDNGGVNGRKIKYNYLDDAYNPAQTVPLTKQLVEQDQVFAMFGGLGTQAQVSVEQYLNTKKVPQVFVATGDTRFSADKDKYPYTFGWQPTYQGEALIYAKTLLKDSPDAKVGVIYQNDDYGQDYLNGLKKGLGSKASTMIVSTQNNEVGAPDVKSQVAALKQSGADTLMIFETPSPAIKTIATVAAFGWHPTIYLNSVAAPVPYLGAAQKATGSPAAVNGILTVNYVKDALDPANASDAGVVRFNEVMTKYYPDGKPTDAFNMYGMAVAYTMVDVLKKAGDNPTRKSLISALNNFTESDNPFLAKGVTAKNTAKDHFTITQEAVYKYDAAQTRYIQQGDFIDVRGKITYP
ncbi:MAG: ABC transporter substrate-binding protein [Candidatus Dormibacteria bacterium]